MFFDLLQITAEWQSGKMSSIMKVHMMQKCAIEVFHAEKKIAHIDIHGYLQWILEKSVLISSVDSDMCNKSHCQKVDHLCWAIFL